MQRAKTSRGRRPALPALYVMAAVAVFITAGCTAGTSRDSATSGASPSSGVAIGRCAIEEAASGQGLLTLSDSWPTAGGGGHAVQITALDPRACAAISSASPVYIQPRCTAGGFPWYPATERDGALAHLGVRRIRSVDLVSPQGERIRETVLEFATRTDSGIATVKGFTASCGNVESQDDHGMWADVQGKPIALTVVDRLLVAVEFETPSFDRTTQSAILQKAHSAAGLIQ